MLARVDRDEDLLREYLGSALVLGLFLNDVAKRMDVINGSAVTLTRAGLWRFAEAAQLVEVRIKGNAERKGADPAQQIEDELLLLR